jgi:hypothetical protein
MITIFNENYYLNLDNLDKFVNVPSTLPTTGDTEHQQQIAIVKYEMIKLLTDVIMTESEDIDDKLGSKATNQLTIPFKLAWNTMLNYKFIEKY